MIEQLLRELWQELELEGLDYDSNKDRYEQVKKEAIRLKKIIERQKNAIALLRDASNWESPTAQEPWFIANDELGQCLKEMEEINGN